MDQESATQETKQASDSRQETMGAAADAASEVGRMNTAEFAHRVLIAVGITLSAAVVARSCS